MTVGNIKTGEFIFTGSAQRLPEIWPIDYVLIKALASNANPCYLGGTGVTAPNGVTDTTTGIELSAGEEIEIEVQILSQLYVIGTLGEGLTYAAMG